MLCLTCAFVYGTRLPTPALAVASLGMGGVVEAGAHWKEMTSSCTNVFTAATQIMVVIAHHN